MCGGAATVDRPCSCVPDGGRLLLPPAAAASAETAAPRTALALLKHGYHSKRPPLSREYSLRRSTHTCERRVALNEHP